MYRICIPTPWKLALYLPSLNDNTRMYMYTHLTCRVASLNHELFDNSVKDVAIVVATASVHTEVFHSLRAAASQYRTQHTL